MPALVVALPLFVAALDVTGVVGGAPGSLLPSNLPTSGDPLTLELPAWGGGPAVVHVSVADVVFLAAYAAYARRFALRDGASAVAMSRPRRRARRDPRSSTAGSPRWRSSPSPSCSPTPTASAALLAGPREG